jgi:hypothetical protein
VFTERSELNLTHCSASVPGRAMAQAVCHRSDTAEAWVRSQIIPCEICGIQSGTGTGFSPSTSVSPVSIIPPMLHTRLQLHVVLTRTNRRSLEAFQQAMFVQISGALYRPVVSYLFFRPVCLLTVMQPHSTNGPQSANSDLAEVYFLPFTMNRAPPQRYKPVHSADSGHMQACSTCYVVPATLAIFGLHAGIRKCNTQYTHCIGGLVGPKSGVNGRGKSRPHRDSIPRPSSP